MNTQESLEYARQRHAMAKAMNDTDEIYNWRGHVEFWELKLQNDELLEALEHLLDAVENAHRIDYPVEEARAAIAKAKGE